MNRTIRRKKQTTSQEVVNPATAIQTIVNLLVVLPAQAQEAAEKCEMDFLKLGKGFAVAKPFLFIFVPGSTLQRHAHFLRTNIFRKSLLLAAVHPMEAIIF
jgi:hypothetical protein